MATQLFLLDTAADTHLGTDNVNLRGTAVGWTSRALGTARGSGVVASAATATVTGATPGIEAALTGPVVCEWISPPVAADVTISGTITANLWAAESANAANTAINVVIEIIRANATATRNSNTLLEIVRSTRVTELTTSRGSAINFTTGMTSGGYTGQTLSRGDRLRVRVFGDDAGTMAAGQTFTLGYNGAAAAADGDSYITLTENVTFESSSAVLDQTQRNGNAQFGTPSRGLIGQPFTPTGSGTLTEVRVWLSKTGSPTDNVVLEIQTDSSGSPSGSVVGTVATVTAASLTGTLTQYTYSTSIALTPSTTYWLVTRRSGAADLSLNYNVGYFAAAVGGWGSAMSSATGASGIFCLALTTQ